MRNQSETLSETNTFVCCGRLSGRFVDACARVVVHNVIVTIYTLGALLYLSVRLYSDWKKPTTPDPKPQASDESLETQPSADRRLPLNSLMITVLRCRGLRRQSLEKRGPIGRGRVRKSRMNDDEEPVEIRPANPRGRMEIGNLPHQSTDTYTEGSDRQVSTTFNPNYLQTFRFDDVYDGGLVARIYVEHTGKGKPEMMGKCLCGNQPVRRVLDTVER